MNTNEIGLIAIISNGISFRRDNNIIYVLLTSGYTALLDCPSKEAVETVMSKLTTSQEIIKPIIRFEFYIDITIIKQ